MNFLRYTCVITFFTIAANAQVASYSIDASVTSGSPAIAGTNIQFTIDANNEGPDDAQNVVVTFGTPSSTTFVSLTSPVGWSCTTPGVGGSGPISCSTATLPPGSAVHFFTITTPSSTPRGTILQLDASITSTTTDQSTNDNSVTVSVPVDWVSTLSLTKSAPATVFAGTAFTTTIGINDLGPSSAGDLTLTDVLPPALLFTSINAPGWSCTTPPAGTNGTVTCTIAEVPVGAASITMQLSSAPSEPPAGVTNDVSLASTTDPQSPRTASATTQIAASAGLAIAKSATPSALAGGAISYAINVTNDGPSDAQSVVMTDALPSTVNFQSITAAGWSCTTPAAGSSGTVTCNRATLAAAASAPITIQATLAPSIPGAANIANTATIASATADPNNANNSASASTMVLSPASVSAAKSIVGTTFFETQNVTYQVVLTNGGPAAQGDNPGDEMTDVLPSSLTLVSATATSGTSVANIGTNTVHWNGSIPAGGSVTITIVASIKPGTAGSPIANAATVNYDADGNGTNESTASSNTATFTPLPASALPAMSVYALLAMVAMLSLVAVMRLRV